MRHRENEASEKGDARTMAANKNSERALKGEGEPDGGRAITAKRKKKELEVIVDQKAVGYRKLWKFEEGPRC
jgi:hypothetical protein